MNVHNKPQLSGVVSGAITVTWAATSQCNFEQERIGKIWTPQGKWRVTDGVQRGAYFFEQAVYRDLDEAAADVVRRVQDGTWTMVAGAPRPDLDLTQLHPRRSENFVDAPTTLFVADFDGFVPDAGKDLSKPEHFGDIVVDALRERLAKAGVRSLAKARLMLVATASTGFDPNSKGKPANSCASFRVIVELDMPLTLKQQKRIAEAIGKREGFGRLNSRGKPAPGSCIDTAIQAASYNIFVARPVLPRGFKDPIKQPVLVFDGEDGCERVDVDALTKELGFAGLAEEPPGDARERVNGDPAAAGCDAGGDAFRSWTRLLHAPADKRESLLSNLVKALPNKCPPIGGMKKWIGVGKAIWGACGGEAWGFGIWAEWCSRWEGDDPEENEEEWRGFKKDDRNGIDYLTGWAVEVGAPAALDAVDAIERAKPSAGGSSSPAVDDEPPVDLWKAIDTPELPVDLMPARIEKFVRANARAIGADSAGLAGASLAALAVAIPDSIKLQVQTIGKKWLIAARIWVALVGDPSTKKTPIMDAVLVALRARDSERRRKYASLKAFWEAKSKKEKAEAVGKGGGPPDHNRIIIGDVTAEAAGEILMTSPNGVLGLHDELSGFFGQMERYGKNTQGMADRAFWLKARNGGPFSLDRIVRGSNHIPNLSVTILGGIQPEPMRKVADGSSDDGLIQRLTPIMLRPAELTDDAVDTEEADKDFAGLIDTLLALTPSESPLRFDEGAQKIRRKLEVEHYERTRSWEPINKKMASAFGKQDGFFAELCVIWHAVENAGRNPLPEIVTEDTARRVAAFMRAFLRPHLVAFYAGLLDLSDEHDKLKAIAGYILTHKPDTMNSREVQKAIRSMKKLGAREVASVMEQLEAFGWLFRHPPPRHDALPVWKINPAVHAHFAERAKDEAARRAKDRATVAKDTAARRAAKS
jgi:Protein of unknown function (DUF3987)/Primase C terminal 2 (PriCT-2)